MKRKSFVAAVVACGIGMMTSASLADSYVGSVVLTQGSYSSGVGGEFTATISLPNSPVPGDVSSFDPGIVAGGSVAGQAEPIALSNSAFQTFCIQEGVNDVTFNPGSTYYGILTNSVAHGPNSVAAGTAVLFDQFWNGTLSGYNFLNSNSFHDENNQTLTRQESAGALQAAIWVLEGDQSSIANAEGDAGITGDSDAIAQATTWLTNTEAYVATHGAIIPSDVEILELYGPIGSGLGIAQDQLVEVPNSNSPLSVPLPASANMGILLLVGFGGFSALRKLMKRTPRTA
jgi:hypothetical protein